MIGLSLSLCVKDIVAGRIKEDDVEKIIAGTCFRDDEEWDELMRDYCLVYWDGFRGEAIRVAERLRAAGKIEQPRLRGDPAPNLSNGWWLKT